MADKSTPEKHGERIAKVMARAGLCSRREAEAWIAAGRVVVNGAKVASPALNVADSDQVVVDGKPLPSRERTRLFLFNKPRGLVTTHADPQGRPTIFDALPKDLPRLISVGRLDFTTEGLLLLTNDGGLARALELPATGWLRRYRVRANGSVTQEALDKLRDGITVDGVKYGPIEAKLDRLQGANVWITFAIREGKNREVRNVMRDLGLAVNRLIRVSFGPFQLGELPEGTVEEVRSRVLREQLGDKLAKLAGADFASPLGVRGEVDAPPAPPPERERKNKSERQRPSRTRDEGQRPSREHGESQRPGRAHGEGQRPSREHGESQRPGRAHGEGQRPSRERGESQRPGRAHGEGQRPSRERGEGQRPGRPHGEGPRPSRTHGERQRPNRTRDESQRPGQSKTRSESQRPPQTDGKSQRPRPSKTHGESRRPTKAYDKSESRGPRRPQAASRKPGGRPPPGRAKPRRT